MNHKQRKAAYESLKACKESGYRVQAMADDLGINSAHISHVLSGARPPGPTLIKALVDKGWMDSPPPYPYFKIRRDNAKIAAKQLLDNFGWEYLIKLAEELSWRILTDEAASEAWMKRHMGSFKDE